MTATHRMKGVTVKLKVIYEPIPAVIAFGELGAKGALGFKSAISHAYKPGRKTLALDLA